MGRAPTSTLKDYRRKRDFTTTPEPTDDATAPRRASKALRFVVQKHDASRLHYDFRLEIGGVLASWAVPKGPSLNPKDKRLAVHVEDHPLGYASFEGVIPKGEYGGGPVLVWDQGTWTPEGDPGEGVRKGKLVFSLEGEKLRGGWTLVRAGGARGREKDEWLLIKRDDEHASDANASIVHDKPTSVLSGRTIDEVRGGAKTTKKKTVKKPATTKKPWTKKGALSLDGAREGRVPEELTPQLCTLVREAPTGEGWLHEMKYDGYRIIARKDGDRVRLFTRSGKDWTHRFSPLAKAVKGLECGSCVLDGEAAILDEEGRTSFQLLQQMLKAAKFERLVYFAFDLLSLEGVDLRLVELESRKGALEAMLPSSGLIRYSVHSRAVGALVFREACSLGAEGILSKRADAKYQQGRSKTWLKVKCSRRQEFVVIGWTRPGGSRKHFGSLLLAARDDAGKLVYTGRVGAGFDAAMLRDLGKRMAKGERGSCPADQKPTRAESRGVRWTEPRIVVEVGFTEWTGDRRLRHPVFLGVREDKGGDEVRIERAEGEAAPAPKEPSKRSRPVKKDEAKEAVTVRGVTLSNPARVLFPEAGLTKSDLASYYDEIADEMLPFLEGRPLSVVRCPQGRAKACFYQKHPEGALAESVTPIEVPELVGTAEYIALRAAEDLVSLAQFGVLEIHPWGSRQPDLELPDTLTFDLDPGEGVDFGAVKDAAKRVRAELNALGLESFLKTTGGKGLHVVVPLEPSASWDEAKAFCASLAKKMTREEPEKYLDKMSKAARRGKVFVDYLRNSRGATSVAPYSTRASAGAPVATPLRWDELSSLESGAAYTIETIPRRLSRLRKKPWANYFTTRQRL